MSDPHHASALAEREQTNLIRVGIIGTGLMGTVHARNVARSAAWAELVAVADADHDRARSLAVELGVPHVFTDGVDVVNSVEVDAVIVASPDATHSAYALACIAAGKPVLCEKPLANSVEEAWAVVEAEAVAGRRLLQLGFMREYDAAHVALREVVRSGRLGRVVMFRGTHINQGHPGTMTADRCITQSMVHDIHSARFLTGREIVDVFARTVPLKHDPEVVRLVTLSATFDDGSTALIDVNMAAGYGYEVSAEIIGEHGTANTTMPSWLTVRLAGNAATDVTPSWRERFSEAYRTELDAWLGSVRSGIPEGPGAWDGYVSNVVADATVRSVETGLPVPVVLRDRLRA